MVHPSATSATLEYSVLLGQRASVEGGSGANQEGPFFLAFVCVSSSACVFCPVTAKSVAQALSDFFPRSEPRRGAPPAAGTARRAGDDPPGEREISEKAKSSRAFFALPNCV